MVEVDQPRSQHLQFIFIKEGGATFAYQTNMEGEMIKLLRDWSSDCYKRYVDISMDKRYDSMKAFVGHLTGSVRSPTYNKTQQ